MDNINTGVVLVTKFQEQGSEKYKAYVNYIDRDEAKRKEHIKDYTFDDLVEAGELGEYLEYMDNPKKQGSLFTMTKDFLNPKDKKELKNQYQQAQDNGSLMWQTVISFDNRWLSQLGIYDENTGFLDEAKIRTITRFAVGKMLEKENFTNPCWSASIHYNTDNIHIHIATVEPIPTREKFKVKQYEKIKEKHGKEKYKKIKNEKTGKYEKVPVLNSNGEPVFKEVYRGKFKPATIKSMKREIVQELLKDVNINAEISKLIREDMVKQIDTDAFYENDYFKNAFLDIYNKLPKEDLRMWRYNMNAIKDLREDINNFSYEYIQNYQKDTFATLRQKLAVMDGIYSKAYGKGNGEYMANKIGDLYTRFGNALLKELREYHRNCISNIYSYLDENNNSYDPKKAVELLKQQAEAGDNKANVKLGFIFLSNDYGLKDKQKAKEYFEKASNNGSEFAGEMLENINKNSNSKYSLENSLSYSKKRDIRNALRALRRSLYLETNKWRNQLEYEELQLSISEGKTLY